MPQRKAVNNLPEQLKHELDQQLIKGGFKDYRGLVKWLESQGYSISRSSLHRYGKDFEGRLSALKLATEQARAVVENSPDEADAMGQALARLVQEKLFTVLLELEVKTQKLSLPALTRAIADLGRTSLSGKRWAEEWKSKATKGVENLSEKGLDPQTLDAVKELLHGL